MKKITKIETIKEMPKRLRVAAYARVSSGKDAMLNSLASQVNHYKNYIKSKPEWEFVGVYTDEAVTGTKELRDEFQLMLSDCKAGKIDMIITKSISRFARNTMTLLKTVRDLKAINVDIYFEEQNIHTLSGEGEMILTFLATFAQEESRSISENMKWRIKKDFEKGLIWGSTSMFGYKLENKKYHIVPEEAEIVRFIYSLYLEGYGDRMIRTILDEKGIKPYRKKTWGVTTITKILTNYNYTGDLILQKTFIDNHLTKKLKHNKGELDKYIVSNSHEPIISKEIFMEAQAIRKNKAKKFAKSSSYDNEFKGYIRCGKCGKMHTYRKGPYNNYWICSTFRDKGKSHCDNQQVPDDKIKEGAKYLLNMNKFSITIFKDLVQQVVALPDNILRFELKDGTIKEYVWAHKLRSEGWTDEMKERARQHTLKRYRGGSAK